jgi:hypothetical protein
MPVNKARCAKVSYDSKASAKKDIVDIKIHQKFRSKKFASCSKTGKKLRAYECLRCGKWHITVNNNYRKAIKRVK